MSASDRHYMMKTNVPKIGQRITVRGVTCEIFKIHPMGTIDVVSLCGKFAFRITGLNFH